MNDVAKSVSSPKLNVGVISFHGIKIGLQMKDFIEIAK